MDTVVEDGKLSPRWKHIQGILVGVITCVSRDHSSITKDADPCIHVHPNGYGLRSLGRRLCW